MQRSAWIFLSAIFLPSLGLAWLAIHSVRDQQVVLQHQEAIICQNLTDTLAKNIQDQMDHVREDFVRTTGQLLTTSPSPEDLAGDFNRRLRPAWPLAEIGFAVDLDGRIYSPQAADGLPARKFRDENDRFLSNRENAEVYFSNGFNASGNALTWANTFSGKTSNAPLQSQFRQTTVGGSMALAATTPADQRNQSETTASLPAAPDAPMALTNAAPVNGGVPIDEINRNTRGQKSAALSGRMLITTRQASSPDNRRLDDLASAPVSDQDTNTSKSLDVQQKMKTPLSPAEPVSAAKAKDKDMAFDQTDAASQTEAGQAKVADGSSSSLSQVPAAAVPAPPGSASADTSIVSKPASSPPEDALDLEKVPAASAARASPPPPVATTATLSPPPAPAPTEAQTNAPVFGTAGEIPSVPTMAPDAAAPASGNTFNLIAKTTQQAFASKIQRKVIPQQFVAANDTATLSNTVPAESDFRQVIGSETSGALARILENKLCLMVWSHTPVDSPIVFGAQLDQARLIETLKTSFQAVDAASGIPSDERSSNYCLAILDDSGHPVALSRTGFSADWKHPFVATELDESLPHWEAALYLIDPQRIDRTARTLQLTLGLIVLLLVAAIVAGGSLIAGDVRRQVRLAQQKTDFVSNVSHELKTPLTSIRMFADLLAEKRVPDEQKQSTYLRIIAAEAARLTRLINNVLDFARLERGAPPGEHHACDLVDAVRDVIETCQPHLETSGIAFHSEIETESLPLVGDRDALAQIILNLVSNAEKYGGNDITVRVRRQETAAGVLGCVDVMDRGAGISPKDMKTIFEPFHRLDDSLASGIPGSGLGLTLARRMARAHGGDVTCSARAGGGTCFTLSVPLTRPKS